MRGTRYPLTTLAGRIQWIIDDNGLKQVEFARAMAISANYVYLLTSGKKETISDALAKLIGMTYGVSTEWIIKGKETNHPPITDLRMNTMQKLKTMDIHALRSVAAFIRTLDEVKEENN
jgi:transcriptional regulator with XRE-family HTH domain